MRSSPFPHSKPLQVPSPVSTAILPTLVGGLIVVVATGWILLKVWPGLFIPWWFNTDEVVFYYEVIRQLRLDPSQTFFDIPGTPYMTLTSILTWCWWAGGYLLGLNHSASPSDFAFEHIQGVFTLMRCITLGLYAAAVGLSYDLFRRAAGVWAATVTALLLATLPIHVQYSHFVRTESLGLVLTLWAIWLVSHSARKDSPRTYLIAAALVGIAMGARFHFAFVGLPVLLAIYWIRDRRGGSAQADIHRRGLYAGAALCGIFVIGGAIAFLFRNGLLPAGGLTNTMLLSTAAGPAQYPGAKTSVAKLWFLLGGGAAAIMLIYSIPRTRPLLRTIITPLTLAVALGFAGGFLVAHPTFLWRGEYQLRSIQFYSDWNDPNLQSLGILGSWWNVTRYYFTTALPERWVEVAVVLGLITVLIRRRPLWLAYAIGAAVCFVAHPVTMKLWPHHIIPWLPFLCFTAALPLAWLEELLTQRVQQPVALAIAALAVGGLGAWGVRDRFAHAEDYLNTSRARTQQISEMNAWLSQHVPPDAYLVVSYFSLAEDGFFKWIENSGVRVPNQVKKHRNVAIWWLERSAIDGRSGYLCISRADIAFFHDDFERRNPGSTYNPFEDSRFKSVAKFGGGFYELQVFKFDFTSRPSF